MTTYNIQDIMADIKHYYTFTKEFSDILTPEFIENMEISYRTGLKANDYNEAYRIIDDKIIEYVNGKKKKSLVDKIVDNCKGIKK